jgi:type II secretory pathway pseudopilin PulG
MFAGTVVLNSPSQIFEDVRELTTASNPNAFATLDQAQQGLKLSLKDDLLRYLVGEITFELDNVTPPKPEWKAMLKVTDPDRLQQTLSTLLAVANIEPVQSNEGAVTYRTVKIPSSPTSFEIGYVFVDGYLIIGSSRETVAEAVRLHRSGESLGKSKKFLASLPPGHSPAASALFYQDPMAMTLLQLRQVAPEIAGSLAQLAKVATPSVICVYGEEVAIREASMSNGIDVSAVLVGAAVAIPNLLRSRIAANEASAVGSVRTVNTAQVVYATDYPSRGYAPNLASLGTDPRGPRAVSPDHAGLIDQTLANESCTADAWCTKSWVPIQSYIPLQGAPVQRLCSARYSRRQQHGNKKLLFHLGRRDSLQSRPHSNLAGQCLGMPGVAPAAVAELENSDSLPGEPIWLSGVPRGRWRRA